MNQEIKQLWVDALRSGEYKQGKGALRNKDNNFCCLGVLCNIHAQQNPELAAKQRNPQVYYDENGNLPIEVAKWADIQLHNNDVPVQLLQSFHGTTKSEDYNRRVYFSAQGCIIADYDDKKTVRPWTLIDLNDQGASFKQIADIIEHSL